MRRHQSQRSRVAQNGGILLAALLLSAAIGAAPAGARGWSIEPTPNPPGLSSSLTGVSCATTKACVAVGTTFRAETSSQLTLAEVWNGAKWSVTRTVNPANATSAQLNGVSCVTATLCIAGGSYTNSAGVQKTLIERFNGRAWTVLQSPNIAEATGSLILAVSCSAANACTAVGGDAFQTQSLAERWNGVTWRIQPTPQVPGSVQNVLNGVSCTSSTFCMADGQAVSAMTESWDGTSWTIQPADSQFLTFGPLTAVACRSTSACESVGFQIAGPSEFAAAQGWDGSSWTGQQSADPQLTGSALNGVACMSSAVCHAVGFSLSGGNPESGPQQFALAEAWNGTTWTVRAVQNPAAAVQSDLGGVSCPAPGNCTAVGTYTDSKGIGRTLAEGLS